MEVPSSSHSKSESDYFIDYVNSVECKKRYSEEVILATDEFKKKAYCLTQADELIESMLDAAVEYERSGFIAGFDYACGMIRAILFAGVDKNY